MPKPGFSRKKMELAAGSTSVQGIPVVPNVQNIQGLAFSMKDLALSPQAVDLRESGVSSLKIEGRKKSALFVAATVHLYRQILDGSLSVQERQALEAEVQTIFSRPWTSLYFHSSINSGVVDTQWVGHRGARIGTLKAVVREDKKAWIRFKSTRALSRYDGLQIDIPGIDRPFGFSVQELRTVNCKNCKKKSSSAIPLPVETPAGVEIEVALPRGYPTLPLEAAIYCSSSQQVKQRYRIEKPNMCNFRTRWGLKLVAELGPDRLILNAQADHPLHANLNTTVSINGSFAIAQNPSKMEIAARQALEKLGDSRFYLENWEWSNPQGLFVPLSQLNDARRVLIKDLEVKLNEADSHWCAAVEQSERKMHVANRQPILAKVLQWSIKVDSFCALQGFDEWENVDQLVFDIGREPPNVLVEQVQKISQRLGMQRVRLALPVITRDWEEYSLQTKIADLKAAGFYRWEVSNISAFSFLAPLANQELWTDGALAVLNNLAAEQMIAMGAQGFTLSVEDALPNMTEIVTNFADKATVVVYQDTPLFISESCPYANLYGQCLGHRCSYNNMQLTSTQYPTNTLIACRQGQTEGQSVNRAGCRAVIINHQPYSIAEHLELLVAAGVKKVRVDFLHKQYNGQQVQNLWRELRQATKLGHSGNFERSW
jgi:putative protease